MSRGSVQRQGEVRRRRVRRGEGWLERWREREVRDELVEDLRMEG